MFTGHINVKTLFMEQINVRYCLQDTLELYNVYLVDTLKFNDILLRTIKFGFIIPATHVRKTCISVTPYVFILKSYDTKCFQNLHFNSDNTTENVASSDYIVLNKFKE